MAKTINMNRTLGVENEARLAGAEALEVEGVVTLDQIITAATEEQTVAIGSKDRQLRAASLVTDQPVTVQMLGTRHAILETVAGPPGTITHTGDLGQEIFAGDLVRLEGMPTAADDGIYKVDSDPAVGVIEVIGVTTITLALGQDINTAGGGAVGTIARVVTQTLLSNAYAAVTVTAATGAITFTGDLTDVFEAGDFLIIEDSTGNDGFWEIVSVAFAAPTTTIIVQDKAAVAILPDNTDDGNFTLARDNIALAANVPYLWSIDGGIPNPFRQPGPAARAALFNAFRGQMAFCMVTCPGVTNANFQGRLCFDANLIP